MVKKKPKLLVLIPFYQNVPAPTAKSLMQLVEQAPRYFEFQYFTICATYITIARNTLFNEAHAQYKAGKCDYVLCLDSDQVFDINNVVNLFNHYNEWKFDILAGHMHVRSQKVETKLVDMIFDFKFGSVCWKQAQPDEEYTQCDGTGMGFMLMSGKVLDKIVKGFAPAMLSDIPIMSKWGEAPIKFLGEDVYFFKKVKELGITVAIDNTVQIGHYGFCR